MNQLTPVRIKTNIKYYNKLIQNKKAELLQLVEQRNKLVGVFEDSFKDIKVLKEENEKLKQEIKKFTMEIT